MTDLIVALLPLIAQYGPGLVNSVAVLIHGNPQQAGETEDAYVLRIKALTDAKLADALANDAEVIDGSPV